MYSKALLGHFLLNAYAPGMSYEEVCELMKREFEQRLKTAPGSVHPRKQKLDVVMATRSLTNESEGSQYR